MMEKIIMQMSCSDERMEGFGQNCVCTKTRLWFLPEAVHGRETAFLRQCIRYDDTEPKTLPRRRPMTR